jgi:cell division protein FtsI (penicillin-binding protein 3)
VLAISVVIDEPKGAIFGGVVAAPIFREIAAQTLPYLGYYPKTENAPVLAGILPAPAAAQTAPPEPKAHLPRSLAPKEPLKVMPDVRGLTIRQVIDLLHKSGLHFRFEGSGLAAGQDPAPGSPISPGDTCAVKFRSPS